MKPRSRNIILLIVSLFCLGILIIYFIPGLWFQRHLSKNWNVPESGMDLAEFSRLPNRLCLIFAVDGVPFDIMDELYAEGYFKGFYKPGRLVSTFPSLTRAAFSKMLIGGKPFGYERLYFDSAANQIKGFNLVKKLFSTEKEHLDYHPKLHFLGFPGYIAYVFPDKFTKAAIEGFKNKILNFKGDEFIAYMGLSDAIAHVRGRQAQKDFMKQISALMDMTRNELGILLDVIMFSDHGNNYADNQRVDLVTALENNGFRDASELKTPTDYILPRNGFVSVAALYSHPKNAGGIAAILSRVEGVDFSVFRQDQSVMVQGAAGYARISKRDNHYRYEAIQGDPLLLANIQDRLQRAYPDSAGSYFPATGWWQATRGHIYPDPLHRIWEGLDDLVQHPATMLISLKDGYAFGPAIFDQAIVSQRAGTHGALLASHSNGFLMSDFMPVKAYNRPQTVANLLAGAAEAKREGKKLWPFN